MDACDRCGLPTGGERGVAVHRHDGGYSLTCATCSGDGTSSPASEPGRPVLPPSRGARSAARHEAAHLAAALLLGVDVEQARCEANGDGSLSLRAGELDRNPMAGALIAAAPWAIGLDGASEADLASLAPFDASTAEAEARGLLDEAPGLVDELEAALRERGSLSGAEALVIFEGVRRWP